MADRFRQHTTRIMRAYTVYLIAWVRATWPPMAMEIYREEEHKEKQGLTPGQIIFVPGNTC